MYLRQSVQCVLRPGARRPEKRAAAAQTAAVGGPYRSCSRPAAPSRTHRHKPPTRRVFCCALIYPIAVCRVTLALSQRRRRPPKPTSSTTHAPGLRGRRRFVVTRPTVCRSRCRARCRPSSRWAPRRRRGVLPCRPRDRHRPRRVLTRTAPFPCPPVSHPQQVAKLREEEASDASWFVLPEEGDEDVNWMNFTVEIEGPVRACGQQRIAAAVAPLLRGRQRRCPRWECQPLSSAFTAAFPPPARPARRAAGDVHGQPRRQRQGRPT